MRPANEQTILITGATDGLGKAVAGELAEAGAAVLLHGRDEGRLSDAAKEIGERSSGGSIDTYRADLSSLEEVRGLAEAVERDRERLDVLVNNAGIGTTVGGDEGRKESADGYELRFAVNYLAGFLLTRRLLDLLVSSAPSRIVNVSSLGQAPIDFDDVMLERNYSGLQAYCQSKLAQVMFTFDLAEELRDSDVTANCLHPATYMPTKMVRDAGARPASSLEEGVEATSRLILDAELDDVSGEFFDGLRRAAPHPQAIDPDARRQLRELSERLTG